MDTIYLLPGEERCVDFRDANGVPKVHYTYCSIRSPSGKVCGLKGRIVANLLTSVNSLNKKSSKIYCRVQLSIRQL